MVESNEALYREFANARPGHRLVAVEPAAFPVTVVNATVLAQERKPLPAVEEFTLRCVLAGRRSISAVAEMLGLEVTIVESAVVSLAAAGALHYDSSAHRLSITPSGTAIAREHGSVRPVERSFKTPFDRMTWAVTDYGQEDLLKKSVAKEEGRILLPATQTRKVVVDDIDVRYLNRVLADTAGARDAMEILRVLRVQYSTYLYMKCSLLVFQSDSGDLEFGVIVDGKPSSVHDIALVKAGGPGEIAVSSQRETAPPAALPEDVTSAAEETDHASPPLEAVSTSSDKTLIRSIDMYEHRILLDEALSTAAKRILLVSPWVKSAVVNTDFMGALERALRRGVQVDIAHGIGEDDRGSDSFALSRLANLQRRYPDELRVTRHPNTHAKILIFDDVWVATSFNWLSFRGDADRTYRMEEGTLVRSRVHADREYLKYKELLSSI